MMKRTGITWFECLLALSGGALPIGLVLMLVAPVSFFHAVGAAIVGMGLIGLWVAALGLQLEHPERWHALKASVVRLAAPAPRRTAER
jgi:hypothetical protein